MKTFYLLIIGAFLSLSSNAQIVEIPDPNFAAWINFWYSGCIEGNMLDTQCPQVLNATWGTCAGENIENLEGLQYFVNLQGFDAHSNNITTFPELPPSLFDLDLTNNPIGNLDSIPEQLTHISLYTTQMTELPEIHEGVITLIIGNNSLTELPQLPSTLEILNVRNNPIDSLFLPESITQLQAQECQLDFISSPLPNCTFIEMQENNLTMLPVLPDSLDFFAVNNNQISCFNYLPTYGIGIIGDNPFTCLPHFPEGAFFLNENEILTPELYPICQENDPDNNPFGCESSTGLEGYVFLDQDAQCDYNESSLQNIPFQITENGEQIAIVNSYSNGRYLFIGQYGDYQVELDDSNTPFINNCGNQMASLDGDNPFEPDLNFALNCAYENDLGVLSIVPFGWVFPGQEHTTRIFAGEVSQLYNAQCSSSAGGELVISLEGSSTIVGATNSNLEQLPFDDTTVTIQVDDFTQLDLFSSFNLEILTDSAATLGDEICLTVEITGFETDPVLENNTLTFCYPVVNSFDPNNKLVSPMYVESGFDDWLIYTINFQNTGNAPAFNIRLEDELPANLDLETFQMMNTSHNSYFELEGNNLVVQYPDIMLADSTSNESESKGYFQFKVHTLEPMAENDMIENSASIYFDFNDPIITNTAITSSQLPDLINESERTSFKLFPNPSSGRFSITSNEPILEVSCVSIIGENLKCEQDIQGKTAVTELNQAAGIVIVLVKTKSGISRQRIILE